MAPTLEGRVFARLHRFEGLPADLQDDTKQFEAHVLQDKSKLFQTHHHALVKPVYSVRGKALVDAVIRWLQARDAPEPTPAALSDAPNVEPAVAAAVEAATAEATATEAATTEATGAKAAEPAKDAAPPASATPSTAPPASTTSTATTTAAATASPELRERARQIAEALVLSGFLTPYKDDEKHVNAPPPEHYVRDGDLLIPVAAGATELGATSVWGVAARAKHASVLKRKAGVLAPFTHGKDAYVVFTEDAAFVFDSDLARAPVAEFIGAQVAVQFDSAHFEFGVRVALAAPAAGDKDKPELFNAGSKAAQDAFVHAWLNAGATYREAFNLDAEAASSIYELKDRDIDGRDVAFERYRGKVLLIVNVSSKCGLTPTNYPELTALDEKYRDQGLEVLAFPCNQFAGQEPGTHDEIVAFVKQYNAQYTFFEKRDVNGAHARPVFTYLKAKLPGSFGSFVKWNFTKFLVDRNGQPYKRFAPQELPFSFEEDIVKLLNTPAAADEAVAAVAEAVDAVAAAPATEAAPAEPSAPESSAPESSKAAVEPAAAQIAPAAT